GHPMNTIQNSWKKKISYIPQNFYVLNESIMENIFFSEDESEHDLKKISRALKFSKLDKFVDSLPEKLDTIVGPSGKVLSGGQAQRLSIARALYQDREILIFDEATNALDQDTESQILQNICQLKNTKTIIIISHNKDVMEKCDHVLEIK
ncbi:ABC transporter ATP-binding protein, partial [Candidatus Pelagibacter sp.]|nr:ABC transporter ATP-binding protein [Candidatus Pelagibacter sp.]